MYCLVIQAKDSQDSSNRVKMKLYIKSLSHKCLFFFCICHTGLANSQFIRYKILYECNILNNHFVFKLLSLSASLFILLQFPHLVFGAVASSAPVKAKLDFSAYNNVN